MDLESRTGDAAATEDSPAPATHEARGTTGRTASDPVPARMINEVLYCERLFFLEWCQGEFADNFFTVDGRLVHKRADDPQGRLPERADEPSDHPTDGSEDRPYRARSVWLSSNQLGITAKIDVVEGEGGRAVPIEYKRGRAPSLPERAYLPERAQVCAQVLLLREHGFECDHGELYFAADKKRVVIPIDAALIEATLNAVRRARELAAEKILPPPLRDSPKCNGCSLAGICLPDEVALLQLEAPEAVALEESAPSVPADGDAPRRLYAARDDRVPLYVQSHRARVSTSGERLIVRDGDVETEARLPNTSQVVVFGNAQVTTQALRALLDREIPLLFFTYGGWFLGRTSGLGSKNIDLRIAQHERAADRGFSLRFSRSVVASKILNCRTMLRRNATSRDEVALKELKLLANKAHRADSVESLLGIEGTAARLYFQQFSGMLVGSIAAKKFDLDGRNRRPPRDPVNAMLSFCYGLLAKDLHLALTAVGLEPLLGFYHRPRHGRPALALDLMEEFRPLVADSVVISAINNGIVGPEDFISAAGSCALRPHARQRLIAAYERRMDDLITHPVFNYRLSYRRVLELQARLLTRVIFGEIPNYPTFRTR